MTATPQALAIAGDPQRLEEAARYEMARRWLLPFVKETFPRYEVAPVHKLIARRLQAFEAAVERRESPRLMIFMPPRVGKSELVSRRFPPWVLGRHPDWNVFLVSYGAELAEELSADARRVVMDDAYQAIFGRKYEIDPGSTVELDRASKSVAFWRISGHRGGLRAVGVGGALTGRGADVLVIDDPIKGRKEADSKAYKEDLWRFYTGTLYDRVEPGGGIVLMQTRWAVDDLAGRLLLMDGEDEDTDERLLDKWDVLVVPAQAEEGMADALGRVPGEWRAGRFSEEKWRKIRANTIRTSERDWHAKYQQRPLPDEGAVFHVPDDLRFEDEPAGYRGPRFLLADTSYGKGQESDYSGIQVWQLEPNGTLGLLDFFEERLAFPDLKRTARRMYLKQGCAGGVIEDYGSGTSLIQEFQRESGMHIVPWRPDRDKRARGFAATDVMRGGIKRVRFPKVDTFPSGGRMAHLLETLRNFTGLGDMHDDCVDVLTMACICLGTHDIFRKWSMPTEMDFEIVA